MAHTDTSITELAVYSGLARPTIYDYVEGRRLPGLVNLFQLAQALDVEADRLIEMTPEQIESFEMLDP